VHFGVHFGYIGRDKSETMKLIEQFHVRMNVSQVDMATTEMVHVRIDKRTKAKAAKALAAMGLSVSDAVRVLLTRVATEKALPFEVKAPNAATAAAMQEARNGGLRSFRNVSHLMADLNAED
jgi:DNA-damage-inducible protein J